MTETLEGYKQIDPLAIQLYPDAIRYEVKELPKAMQETTCQKVWRIAYLILSIIIFPIGLVRLIGWGIQKCMARFVLPAAYMDENRKTELRAFREEIFQKKDHFPIQMTTPDGEVLDGVWIRRNQNDDATTIIYFNPNAASFEDHYDIRNHIAETHGEVHRRDHEGKPVNEIYFNYRGVVESTGSPSPNGLLLDGWTVVRFAVEKLGIPKNRIITHGWSLGGMVAAFGASQNQEEVNGVAIGVNSCNDRSLSSLPGEIEALAENYICSPLGCCLGKTVAFIAKWVGWDWNAAQWWQEIRSYKWAVIHPDDQVIPEEASLVKAWKDQEVEGNIQANLMVLDSNVCGAGHMRCFTRDEYRQYWSHVKRALA